MHAVPAMNADNADPARAREPCPFSAIGYPSKALATDIGVPGMLKRMEVTEPP